MNEVVLFGAGEIGKKVAFHCYMKKRKVNCFIDNDVSKQGKMVMGILVIDLDTYLKMNYGDFDLILCLNESNLKQVYRQLERKGYTSSFQVADGEYNDYHKKRIISYTGEKNSEDVILYHVLRNEKEIFYIDVGSNDPFVGSVTKLLYDTRGACGINIDPQEELINRSKEERPKDINLCLAVGDKEERKKFFLQGGLSTFVYQNVKDELCPIKEMKITTLKKICEKYIKENTHISFLKIDVEGYEREVLLGADFELYRPYILVIESTEPCTTIPTYEKWENILLKHSYHFVFAQGVNRYYVANERSYLDKEFFPDMEYYRHLYDIKRTKLI